MEKKTITFSANEQKLIKTGGIDCYASNTVAYIEAHFDLGENWDGYDSVRAVWWNDYNKTVSTVLDSDGACIVPYEVLTRKSAVKVNLVGSIADGDVLTDRLTTCPVIALTIKCNAKTDGDNTQPITPSEYEQFVAEVKADADRAEAGAESAEASAQSASESATASANSASDSAQSATASAQSAQNASESAQSAENAKDDAEDARDEILGMRATAETLEAGSDATASYSDGVLTLGIPRGDKGVKGDKGDTGATPNFSIGEVDTLEPNESATATITGTTENPVLNLGIPKGDTGDVNLSQLEALLPTETASGSMVTITDGQAIVPAKSLKVALEPIQDLNGYDKPWAGGAGKNKLNNQGTSGTVAGVTYTVNSDGSVSTSGTSTGWNGFSLGSQTLPAGTYILSSGVSNTHYYYKFLSASINGTTYETNNGDVTFTLTEQTTFTVNLLTRPSYARAVKVYPMIRLSSVTDASYEPYSNICPISGWDDVSTYVSPTISSEDGTTYTTVLGRTVYGGQLDVVSGKLTVDKAMVDLTQGMSGDTIGGNYLYYKQVTDAKTVPNSQIANVISEAYEPIRYNGVATTIGTIAIRDNKYLYVNTGGQDTLPTGNAVYELATPQTIQLTPQEVELLTGTNNVWSDGNVTLVYSADIQRYIEKKLGTRTTLTMSRPMTAERTDAESESADTNSVDTEQVGDGLQ